MEQKKVFRSRISVLVIVFMLLIFIPIFIPFIQYGDYRMLWKPCLVLLFVLFLFMGMRYIIAGDRLFVKIWFIPTWSISVMDIDSVKRSYNPLSSPAASLKRLSVFSTANRECLISPVREQEFIETLRTINPDIDVNVPSKKGIWRVQDWDI